MLKNKNSIETVLSACVSLSGVKTGIRFNKSKLK